MSPWKTEKQKCEPAPSSCSLISIDSMVSPQVLPFDHSFTSEKPSEAIFYADLLDSHSFEPLYYALSSKGIPFTLRWKPSTSHPSQPLHLSSYAAALHIKKSEYLAIDDRGQQKSDAQQHLGHQTGGATLEQLWEQEDSAPPSLKPLTSSDLLGE